MTFPVPVLPGMHYQGLPQTLLMGERTCTAIAAAPVDHTAATVKVFSAFDPKVLDLHNSSRCSRSRRRSDGICKGSLLHTISAVETEKHFVDPSFPQTCKVDELIVYSTRKHEPMLSAQLLKLSQIAHSPVSYVK